MKWFIGFFVLLIALVAISGCTQSVQPVAPATTIPTTVPTPEPVLVVTPVPTTHATPVPTPKIVVINVTRVVTPTTAIRVTTIHITSNGFTPAVDGVLPGTGINWVNDDTVSHSVKAIGVHEGMFNSGEIIPTSTWSFDFGEKEGIYEYALGDLPTIKGQIIVKAGRSVVG